MIAIADTSFVLAVGNRNEKSHAACLPVYTAHDKIILPQSTLAEVGYMLGSRGGNRATAQFLRTLPRMRYEVTALLPEDLSRTAEILDKYADARLDFVDATIVAVAERLQITRILTLDRRDFQMLRPNHAPFFEILP